MKQNQVEFIQWLLLLVQNHLKQGPLVWGLVFLSIQNLSKQYCYLIQRLSEKMDVILLQAGFVRRTLFAFTNSDLFASVMIGIILLNTIILGLETNNLTHRFIGIFILMSNALGWYFDVAEHIFLGIYMTECILKIYAWRWYYFKSGWNLFGKDCITNDRFIDCHH